MSCLSTKHFLLSSRSWDGIKPIVSPASCRACHQLESPPFTTYLYSVCAGRTLLAPNYMKNIAITKWKPNLSTGQKRVFCRVIAEQAPDIILKTNNHISRRVKLLLPYFAGLQLFFLWYWKAGFDWLREWAGSSGWWIPRFLQSGIVAKWKWEKIQKNIKGFNYWKCRDAKNIQFQGDPHPPTRRCWSIFCFIHGRKQIILINFGLKKLVLFC